MSTKHTPGPWRVFERMQTNGILVTSEDGRAWLLHERYIAAGDSTLLASVEARIGDRKGWPDVTNADEMLANARLIAAAPELLEACKRLQEAIGDCDVGTDDHDVGLCNCAITGALRFAQAAIAKAEGK